MTTRSQKLLAQNPTCTTSKARTRYRPPLEEAAVPQSHQLCPHAQAEPSLPSPPAPCPAGPHPPPSLLPRGAKPHLSLSTPGGKVGSSLPVGWLVTELRVKINPKRNAGLWAPSLSRAQPQTPDVTAAEPPGCPHVDVGLYGQYPHGAPRYGSAAPRFYVGNLLSGAELCTSVPAHRCDESGGLSTAAPTESISRCPPGRAGSGFPRRGDAAGRRKDGEELGKGSRNSPKSRRRRCGQTPAERIAPCVGIPRTRPPNPFPPLPFLSPPLPPARELGLTAVLGRKSSFSGRASDGDGGRGSWSGDCGRGGPAAPGGGSAPPAARPLQPPAPHRDRLPLPPPLPRLGITPCSGPQPRGPASAPTSSIFQLRPPAPRTVFPCFRTRVPSSRLSPRDALLLFRGCGPKSVPGSRIFGSPPALNAGFQAARPSPALRERNHLRPPPLPSYPSARK